MVGTIVLGLGLDMTSWLIQTNLFNCLYSPVRTKAECYRSHDHFSCHMMNCSATRILSSSIIVCLPQPTSSLVGGDSFSPLQRYSSHILLLHLTEWLCLDCTYHYFYLSLSNIADLIIYSWLLFCIFLLWNKCVFNNYYASYPVYIVIY